MSFTGDLRKLVNSSGIQLKETSYGPLVCFESQDVRIVPVPVIADSLEKAAELSSVCESLSASDDRKTMFVVQDRWVTQGDAMKKRVLAHLGKFDSVFARNCEIRRIDKQTASEFLSDCHSYGDASCKYRYGMFVYRYSGKENKKDYSGEHKVPVGTLVAVSEFSNARRWQKGDKSILSYEWIRYASLPGVRVVGGMGKMLKTFIEEVNPDDVMSYADLEWSDGGAYRELGFVDESRKEPVDFWIDPVFYDRIPVGRGEAPDMPLFYRNLGSIKYRLKLTDY